MADNTATLDGAAPSAFKHYTLEAAGVEAEIAEAGTGAAVLYLGSHDDPLVKWISPKFHLHVVTPDKGFAALAPAMKARWIADIAQSLKLQHCALCVEGDNAAAVLHLAADDPEKFVNNVMIAPDVYDERGVLGDPALAEKLTSIASQTLALFGTDASGAVQGAASFYRANIANCHLMYVYDALDPARDRPEAAASVISDFLRRGDGFLVSEQDGRIHP